MAVDVEEIYEQVISQKIHYCELCLRSEHEVQLVPATNIRGFLEHLAPELGFQFRNWQNACCVCEAWAAKGRKLVGAIFASTSAHHIFNRKERAESYQREPSLSRQEVSRCNNQLADTRARTVLRQTEVLIVDSSSMITNAAEHEVESLYMLQPVQSGEDIETVVILEDDEDSTITNASSLAPGALPAASFKQFLLPAANVAIPSTMVITVPPGEVPWVFGGGETNYAILPNSIQDPLNNKNISTDTTDLKEYSEPFSEIRIESIHTMDHQKTFNSSNTISNKRNYDSDNRIVKKKRQEYEVDIDTVNKLLQEHSGLRPKGALKTNNTESDIVKEPLPNKDRIDWEDKIPMDIISYINATDPNADPLLSDKSHQMACADVIDLC